MGVSNCWRSLPRAGSEDPASTGKTQPPTHARPNARSEDPAATGKTRPPTHARPNARSEDPAATGKTRPPTHARPNARSEDPAATGKTQPPNDSPRSDGGRVFRPGTLPPRGLTPGVAGGRNRGLLERAVSRPSDSFRVTNRPPSRGRSNSLSRPPRATSSSIIRAAGRPRAACAACACPVTSPCQ
jgi:hypothetical protein